MRTEVLTWLDLSADERAANPWALEVDPRTGEPLGRFCDWIRVGGQALALQRFHDFADDGIPSHGLTWDLHYPISPTSGLLVRLLATPEAVIVGAYA